MLSWLRNHSLTVALFIIGCAIFAIARPVEGDRIIAELDERFDKGEL